jgi:DNA primase
MRRVIALLIQDPGLASEIRPPYLFSDLRQPGIPLFVELIGLFNSRPEIATSGVLDHFEGRQELKSLQKLAVLEVPGSEDERRTALLDALAQLDRQTNQQRLDDLLVKKSESSLDSEENDELRRLLATKNVPRNL